MDENAKLRKTLLWNFLLTLIFVGVAQIIISALISTFFNPYLERVLSLDGLLQSKDIRETYTIIFQSMLIYIVQKFASSGSFLSGFISSEMIEKIIEPKLMVSITDLIETTKGVQTWWYILRVFLLFLFVFIIWLAPYILAAVFYVKFVTKKVGELEKKRIEKDKAYEKQRNLLLSDIAHDIKTPITTVAGFSKALSDGAVKENQVQEYLDAMYSKSMQISDLVSLLFEYIKLDSAGYQLNCTNQDICEVLRECVARLYTDFELKNMELEILIPDEEIAVSIDKTQFERAINNLLINTLRHNPDGTKVFIEVEKEEHTVSLQISDCGNPIDKDTASHIFEPFVQGDKSRKTGAGNGLGLSITKKIIEMHGGKIVLKQYINTEKYGKVKTFEILMRC